MSIATQIERLQQTKSNLRDSIINKGVKVDKTLTLDDYSKKVDLIDTISSSAKFPINTPMVQYYTGNWNDLWEHYTKSGYTNCDFMFYRIVDMTRDNEMFTKITSFDLTDFDVSSVTSMKEMFCETDFITSINVSNWNTSNVTNMNSMFRYSWVKTLDLTSFDTSNVTDMTCMFSGTGYLTTIKFGSNFNFNSIIGKKHFGGHSYYVFPTLPSQNYTSVKGVLEVINRTVNDNITKTFYFGDTSGVGVQDDESGTLQTLLNSCISKGWTFYNLTIKSYS